MTSVDQMRVLARGSFTSKNELCDKLYAYMLWHNLTDQPFRWSYRPKSSAQKIGRTSGEGI